MLLALGPCENVFFYEIAKMRFENIKILPKKCMLYMSSMVMHFLVLNKDDLS